VIPTSEEEEASGPCSVSALFALNTSAAHPMCRALPAYLLEVCRLPSAFSCEAHFRRHGAYATSQELVFELGLYFLWSCISLCSSTAFGKLCVLVARCLRCFGVRRGRSFLCFRGTGLRHHCAIRWVGYASAMGRRLTSVLGFCPPSSRKGMICSAFFLGILPVWCVGWSFVIDNWVSIP
jgi:hypothetical protein